MIGKSTAGTMLGRALGKLALMCLISGGAGSAGHAEAPRNSPSDAPFAVSATVSPEAYAALPDLYRLLGKVREEAPPLPQSPEEWKAYRAQMLVAIQGTGPAAQPPLPALWMKDRLGDVDVVRLLPKEGRARTGRVLIYIHGGAYTLFSAETSLLLPAMVSAETRSEVLSVDYSLAPEGDPMVTTGQVLAVYRALLESGIAPERIGFFGDSAGGGLATASILRMRDEQLPLPRALVLLSPWVDISGAGDTAITLRSAEPMLDAEQLRGSAAAYAPPAEQRSPYASPVYGDYSKGFVPTLIQAGTREMLLSDAVRQYQVISGGGTEAVLDLYEGMPHVFQILLPQTPEAKRALSRITAFFDRHLAK